MVQSPCVAEGHSVPHTVLNLRLKEVSSSKQYLNKLAVNHLSFLEVAFS